MSKRIEPVVKGNPESTDRRLAIFLLQKNERKTREDDRG